MTVARGGKRGKTAGRGTKGQKARAGHKIRPEIRDVIMRLPKLRGYSFKSRFSNSVPLNLTKIDAAFSNQAKALTLFEDYFANGGDPLHLLSIIAFQLKNMLIVRELIDKKYQYAQILKKTGMHPFFFKKNYEAAQKYTLNNLKNIFQRVINIEVSLKTGQAEAENIFFKIFM